MYSENTVSSVMVGWWSERWIGIRNEYHLMIEVRKLTAMYHAVTQ